MEAASAAQAEGQLLSFAKSTEVAPEPKGEPWKVLVADDIPAVHEVTKLALEGFRFAGQPLEFISAYSAEETMTLLDSTPGIAVVLLDVVMESEDAGFRVIRHLRDSLRIKDTRIVLRTGQPGHAPEREVVRSYDINDYLEKTEITAAKLTTSIYAALRSYRDIRALQAQREDLKRLVVKVSHAATHDDLTGLANRAVFWQRLNDAAAATERTGRKFGVMLIDLDDFKSINDVCGHAMGDAALREFARRLNRCMRKADVIARLGGDEFGVIFSELRSPGDMEDPATRVLSELSQPIRTQDGSTSLSCSIGLTSFPDDADNPEALLRCADLAMYQAKKDKRSRFRFYDEQIHRQLRLRSNMAATLRSALENELLEVFYQPIVSLADGELIGLEALVRLRRADGELILPGKFIQVAEESGLIEDVGRFVIEQVCQDIRSWLDRGIRPPTVAINLSAQELQSSSISDRIAAALDRYTLTPVRLEIEITESALLAGAEPTFDRLEELLRFGLTLTIDDFGIGYSSLGRLRRLPVSKLKIDRSFVADVVTDSDAAAIIGAILSMSDSLNLGVVAEGIETPEQASWLRAKGCHEGQGYLFGLPVPAGQFHWRDWGYE